MGILRYCEGKGGFVLCNGDCLRCCVKEGSGVMFHGYYDYMLKDIKIKPKPTVLHHKTCPICGRERVNIYYSNQLDKYICKKCMDNLLDDKGGAE